MKTEQIKEIITMFEDSTVAKMELESEGMKIKLEKNTQSVTPNTVEIDTGNIQPVMKEPEQKAPQAQLEEKGEWIKSPIVGTFYSSRAKGGVPFVEIGQNVQKGDVLCIIEAMKVMNEIHSPVSGIIRSILPTNESMVEFDQSLIFIGE